MMMVTTYPEDDSRALKVYQHQHHGCAGRPLGACRQSWGTIISRLRRPIRLKPSRSHSARRALCDREGGGWGGTSVHACCVYPREKKGVIRAFSAHTLYRTKKQTILIYIYQYTELDIDYIGLHTQRQNT